MASQRTPKKRPASKRPKRQTLTKNEEAFCQHYALHRIGAEAVRHAFPEYKGKYNQAVAERASKLLAMSKIKARMQVLSIKVAAIADQKFEISAEKVLQELAAIAFQNSADYFTWGSVERPILRKNRKTGETVHVEDSDGKPMFERIPFASIKPSEELTPIQKRAILSVSETISRTGDRLIEAKMADKLGALKLLGQHLTLFKERVEHTGANGMPIQTNTTHTLPDLSNVTDPREALRAFEEFRTQMSGAGKPN